LKKERILDGQQKQTSSLEFTLLDHYRSFLKANEQNRREKCIFIRTGKWMALDGELLNDEGRL
jgi:hypothetical protein